MVLLLIVAALVAPRMSSFFHGRVLSNEARRMLSVINYGQSRAIAEGVPVLVWIDGAHSTYGVEVQPSFDANDEHAVTYTAEPTLSLQAATDAAVTPVDADADVEPMGMPDNLPSIRFTPAGAIAEGSVSQIVIRQGDEGALELVPSSNRLRYEIRPLSN